MKDRKKYILKDAVVLMIVSAMVLSAIPAVSAIDEGNSRGGAELTDFYDLESPVILMPKPKQVAGMGVGSPIIYDNGAPTGTGVIASQLAPLYPFNAQMADDFILGGNYLIEDVHWWGGFWNGNPVNPCDFNIYIYADDGSGNYPTGAGMSNPETTALATYHVTANGALTTLYEYDADLIPPFSATAGVKYWIVFQADLEFPPQFGVAPTTIKNSQSRQGFPELGMPYWTGPSTPTDVAFYLTGTPSGPGPAGDCLPDQCDFELVSINNIMPGPINSLPQIINITIRNNGEVGIPELKLLADVWEKVCGPTTVLCCDNVYDLCDWEAQAAADWSWYDDGDGDTFVLQGGPDNRWLTNDQAWRNTMGEDRSFGGDEDVYLGLSPGSAGYDMLEWHCADTNDISGAACATFTFSHWMEGEYFFDNDGNLNPVDYGTLAYSLDGGFSWTELDFDDFVAYDTEGEWEDVTIKFINTAVYTDTGYYKVCDDCEPGEDDIVIAEDFPAVANLHVRWIWHKDPCLQFEGWYIDNVCLTRTEMYDLILVHQTHWVMELPPCVGEPEDIYFEFPLGYDPEPDTWYQLCVSGQVFDCPDCCEQIFENNEMCIQFFVTDIHDMACIGNEIIDPQDWWQVGDTICVKANIKNMGTFAENNVPVELKVGKQILDRALDAPFETDQMGDFNYYYFTGSSPEVYFRWTQGDATIDGIGDGRSVLPGEESVICAEEGYFLPYLPNGAGCGMADPNSYDLSDAVSADLNFYAKYSMPENQDCDGDGYLDTFWAALVHPTSGPDSAYWWYATEINTGDRAHQGWENNWQYMQYDLKAEAESHAYDGTIPEIEWLIAAFMCTEDGNTIPVDNPIGWSGLMIDNLQFDIVSCGSMEVVATQYTGSLAPGANESITLCWNDAEFSNWCFQKDVQLPGDIDPDNDICWDHDIKVRDSYGLTSWTSYDLTGGDDDCLWQICCTRACDGTCCAWAGVIEETSGHYIPDMDDNMVSPFIPISVVDYPLGVSLQITTWYDFAPGDYGEVYMRNSSSGQWIKLQDTVDFSYKITGNSSGVFKVMEFYITPAMFTDQIQIRFRMKSNSDDMVAEGWYICNVDIIEVTAIGPPPAALAEQWYAFDVYPGDDSLWFDPAIPALNYIAPNAANHFVAGACWVANEGWYGTIYGGTGFGGLWHINEVTGAMTQIASYGSTTFNGLAYDDSTDTMYGATSTDLYTINRVTGATAIVGSFGSPTMIGIASDGMGTLYGTTVAFSGNADLYSINPVTGAATSLGSTGLGLLYAQDIAYHKMTNKLYVTAYLQSGPSGLYELGLTGGNTKLWDFPGGEEIAGFAIPYQSGNVPLAYGILIYNEDFDRENIAPWTCIALSAGDWWDTQTQCISGYPLAEALNNAMVTKLDFTDPTLYHAELYFTTEWDIEADTNIYIEISPDWDGIEPMQDATWISYWMESGASIQGLISSAALVDDDRFVLNEFLGETVYLRFRLTTPGDGTGDGGFWCIHDKSIIFKQGEEEPEPEDTEPPVTNAYFDCDTGKVTLVAVDYPEGKNCGVKATYYKITGDFEMYTGPVTMPEGTNTIRFYSEDLCDNTESEKSKTYTVDTTPPTVELIVPEDGALYLFGSKIMNRILSDTTLCIGKVPVEATASDGTGSGINKVLFSFDGATAWAENSPFTAEFKDMHFGDLVITATALDNVGLESAPDEMTVKVYSIGLF